MVVADAIGIIVGVVMGKHIPEKTIKWISAIIFLLFGLSGVYEVLSSRLSLIYVWGILLFLSVSTLYGAYRLSRLNRNSEARV